MIQDIKFYVQNQGLFTTLFNLGFWSLLLFRWGRFMYGKQVYKWCLIWYLYLILRNLLLLVSKIELPPSCTIGLNLNLVHAYGLVMGDNVTIGNNCTIGPWVVIGHNGKKNEQPVIDDHVYIGAHACILGNVTIGHDCLIGANTVITQDLLPGFTAKVGSIEIYCKK